MRLNSMFFSSDCGDKEKTYFFAYQHSILSEFFQALWFALIANTDVICYLFIFLNTILSMSLLTLPMSLLVCLWACLTIPRPSKRFWLTIIAYTEVRIGKSINLDKLQKVTVSFSNRSWCFCNIF